MTTTFVDALPTSAPAPDEPARNEPAGDPRWVRPSVLALLSSTALLYIWGLGASGWANSFYSAAVQASTHSWKAFFFGSLDSGNSITVDKPPAALWVMDLSARIFGVNSWSVLVPEALMGVAAVGLLYLTVRRVFTPQAGLLAGAVLALTPVATLMFRFNNPDALLVLLLVAAAYAVTRAIESTSTKWLLLAGAFVGTGFISKMMQAFLVVPAFGLAYLVAADTSLRRRILQLLAALGAMIVASGWWVAIVAAWPASSRPYIGGSQDNSILNLIFGYNGFGRITGNETGSVVGGGAAVGGWGPGGGGMWGQTGLLRMFGTEFGSQVAWLIPAALLLLVVMFWATARARRTDAARAQLIIWGGWLLVTGLTFSYMAGIIHPYYAVALAPAIGALVGIGATELWARRHESIARYSLAAAVAITTWWSYVLLNRAPSWHPGVRGLVVTTGILATLGIAAAPYLHKRFAPAVAAGALVAGLVGPAAYSIATAATPHTGSLPSAGPAGSGFGPGGAGGPGGFARPGFQGASGGQIPGAIGPQFGGALPNGGIWPSGPATTGGLPGIGGQTGVGGPLGQANGIGGPSGGLLDAPIPSSALVAALKDGAGRYRWVVATVGSQNAAGYQLGSDEAVMAIGGFNGTDASPTLEQFEQWVSVGKIHYFIPGGTGAGPAGGMGTSGTSAQITRWVEANFAATTIGGTTLYDLSVAPTTGTTSAT